MNKLQLGVSKKDITPKIGGCLYGYRPNFYSDSVRDNLEAVAFVFYKDGQKMALISATVVAVANIISDRLRKEIEQKIGIKYQNIMIHGTHTHTGPATSGSAQSGWGNIDKEYVEEIFIPQVMCAVEEANENLVPVKVGMAEGDSFVGVNRREHNDKNIIDFGQCPWGVFNPKMTVISFADYDGNTVANIVHYGCHATAGGHIRSISRDWPGIMTDRLEVLTGGITAFINGPEGDVGPRLNNGKTVAVTCSLEGVVRGDVRVLDEIGAVAAHDAVRIYNKIKTYSDANVSCCSDMLKIPIKPRMELKDAQEYLVELEAKNDGVNIRKLMADFCKNTIKSYEDGYVDQEYRETQITAIRIGDVVIAGYEFELFSEIGLRLQNKIKNAYFLPIVNTNGTRGYLSTQGELAKGGYEVDYYKCCNIQPYVDDADWQIIQETIRTLDNLINN